MIELINTTTRSASFKFNNNDIYYTKEYDVYLNSKYLFSSDKNVFTIYDLSPNSSYELKINDNIVNFKTKYESVMLNVKRFIPTTKTLDKTPFIQAAISCAPKNSTVYLPRGEYLVTSLFLKSDITLYLAKGAILKGFTDRLKYSIFPSCDSCVVGVWEGENNDNFASLINVIDCDNVNIVGEGIIDGDAVNGDWYIDHRNIKIAYRGHLIFTNRSNNINIIGLEFKDSYSWTIHPFLTNNINIINVDIKNKPSMPTTDGIDPEFCENVYITGCNIDVGDDCIAIKSGSYSLALKLNKTSKNILIENNFMNQGHGGVVLGSEISAGVENLVVKKCIFKNTDRGLRIKTRRGRGCVNPIDNVVFDNIIMDNVKTPFVINMYYNMGNKGGHSDYVASLAPLEFNHLTPVIKGFTFSNMECKNVWYIGGIFLGLSESKIEKVVLKNCHFSYNSDVSAGYPVMIEYNHMHKNEGIYALNVKELVLENTTFSNNAKVVQEES